MASEPPQAFPHLPPSSGTREKYRQHLFLDFDLTDRSSTGAFNLAIGLIALLAGSVLFLARAIAHGISMFLPREHGSLLVSYKAVSRGVIFRFARGKGL